MSRAMTHSPANSAGPTASESCWYTKVASVWYPWAEPSTCGTAKLLTAPTKHRARAASNGTRSKGRSTVRRVGEGRRRCARRPYQVGSGRMARPAPTTS